MCLFISRPYFGPSHGALKVSQLINYITAPNNETFKTGKKTSKTHNKKTTNLIKTSLVSGRRNRKSKTPNNKFGVSLQAWTIGRRAQLFSPHTEKPRETWERKLFSFPISWWIDFLNCGIFNCGGSEIGIMFRLRSVTS